MAVMMRRTSSVVLAAVAFAALTSCSSGASEEPSGEGRPGGAAFGPATERRTGGTATPAPSPTGPCADGTCEVEVAAGDVLAVPEKYGLGPIEVKAVKGGRVEMAAPLTGAGYSVSGCSGGGGVSSQGGGGVSLSCGEGPAATINGAMRLQVVEIREASAVLRVSPVS